MGALQKTCTYGGDGDGIWGASSLYLVKRLQSSFVASEAGCAETGEGFQKPEGRLGKGRGGSGRFPVPFPLWTDASLYAGLSYPGHLGLPSCGNKGGCRGPGTALRRQGAFHSPMPTPDPG